MRANALSKGLESLTFDNLTVERAKEVVKRLVEADKQNNRDAVFMDAGLTYIQLLKAMWGLVEYTDKKAFKEIKKHALLMMFINNNQLYTFGCEARSDTFRNFLPTCMKVTESMLVHKKPTFKAQPYSGKSARGEKGSYSVNYDAGKWTAQSKCAHANMDLCFSSSNGLYAASLIEESSLSINSYRDSLLVAYRQTMPDAQILEWKDIRVKNKNAIFYRISFTGREGLVKDIKLNHAGHLVLAGKRIYRLFVASFHSAYEDNKNDIISFLDGLAIEE